MGLGITAIDHVQVAVPRALEAEALAFYREVLGLPKSPSRRSCAPAAAPGSRPAICRCMSASIPIPTIRRRAPSAMSVSWFGDLAAAKAAALAKGVAIEEESVAEGLARFFIRDPAGNRIEIGTRV